MINNSSYPRVSIIMPTYNRALYIMESIESVLQQTYQNWELIIVDDASEDDTGEIIKQVTDKRIRYYRINKTGFGARIKSIGIEKAEGELIAFLDSDDMWAPDKLEKQLSVLEQYPDAGFSITGGYNFLKPNEPLEYFYQQREGYRYGDIFLSFFLSEASVLPPTLMCRRKCLQVIHEYAVTDPNSDIHFVLGLALNFKAVILYEPLLYRRLHQQNTTGSGWENGFSEGVNVINRYKRSNDLPTSIANNALFRLYLLFGENYLKRNRRAKAIACFFKAWSYKPFSIVPLKKTRKLFFNI